MNNSTFTKLQDGTILDTFYSSFSGMIVTRHFIPEIDEDGDFSAPFGKNIIIDKIISPTKNVWDVDIFIEKQHKKILRQLQNNLIQL